MRRMMPAIVFFLCSSSLTEAAPCMSPGTMVFYLNGMFNSEEEAREGRDNLRDLVSGSLDRATTQLFHNQDEGLLSLLEVAAQRALPDYRSFWIWLAGREKQPSWYHQFRFISEPKSVQSCHLDSLLIERELPHAEGSTL